MILRSLICDAVVNFFESESWQELIRQMRRGKEVRHAHAYAESILHPEPLLKVVEEYFRAQGLPLQRKIYLLPPANVFGVTDIYNIHPHPDWGHCELIMRYNPDRILSPRTGKSVEVWDDTYMERHYAKFNFKRAVTKQEEKDLRAYFHSAEWKWQSNFMLGGNNRHAHSLVETSIHPEVAQKYLVESLEGRGWEVTKSVSVVYNNKGMDFGKITTLLRKPEIMLELEWEFNAGVSIKPGAEPMILKTTLEDLHNCMAGLDYICLDDSAIDEIVERLKAKTRLRLKAKGL